MYKLEVAKTCGACKHGDFANKSARSWRKPRHKNGKCLLISRSIHQQNTCDAWEEGHKARLSEAKKFVEIENKLP